jgi:hypothetical protein
MIIQRAILSTARYSLIKAATIQLCGSFGYQLPVAGSLHPLGGRGYYFPFQVKIVCFGDLHIHEFANG